MSCKACRHPQRDTIDRQLIAGTPLRHIVASTGLSLGGLSRHRTHLKQMMGDALKDRTESERVENGSDLLQRVQKLVDEAEGVLQAAKAAGNLKAATAAICAAVRTLELVGRLTGELQTANTPGLHLTLQNNRITNVVNIHQDDVEIAQLIAEGTNNFDPREISRLRELVAHEASGVTPDALPQLPEKT
jgi:hypothetical protein